MKNRISALLVLTVFLMALVPTAMAGDKKAPTTAEKMSGLQTMCEESAQARSERQEADSLYNRLGGYDKILKMTQTIVANHAVNDEIKHTLKGVDHEMLAKHVADFMAAGTGGTAEYTGRTMPAAHAHLELTDADFLSAGGDIVKAMKSMEYGENEINDFLCILVSMKDQVVFK